MKINQSKAALASLPSWMQVILASCLMGIFAQVKIPLYFTPVPFTIQTSVAMLAGTLLGKRKGTIALLCCLIEGCLGLPVWAGGASGALHLVGPTGGYLIGHVVQAFFVGWFLEKKQDDSLLRIGCILFASIVLQMGIGSLWLAQFVGMENCLKLGFFPFFISEVAKMFVVTSIIKFFKNQTN